MISQDIINKGVVTIYPDTDLKVLEDVKIYNKQMDINRTNIKHLSEIRFGYLVLNITVLFSMFAGVANDAFSRLGIGVSIGIVVLYLTTLIIFLVFKENLTISTIGSLLSL